MKVKSGVKAGRYREDRKHALSRIAFAALLCSVATTAYDTGARAQIPSPQQFQQLVQYATAVCHAGLAASPARIAAAAAQALAAFNAAPPAQKLRYYAMVNQQRLSCERNNAAIAAIRGMANTQLQGFANRSNMIARFGQNMRQMQNNTYQNWSAGNYRNGQNWIATLGGNVNMQDPATGNVYSLPYGYGNYGIDNRGLTPGIASGPNVGVGTTFGNTYQVQRLLKPY